MGPNQPVYGLQALGLDGKSEPYARIEDMAACYIDAIQTVQPQGPYLLSGHSFGGQVAFEMAQQLLRQGHRVALLAILDNHAPMVIDQSAAEDWDNAGWLSALAEIIGQSFGVDLEISHEALRALGLDEQFDYLLKQMQRTQILPPDAGIDQIRGFVRVFQANHRVKLINYAAEDIWPVRIALFRSHDLSPEDIDNDAFAEILRDPTLGWSKFGTDVDVHLVSGDHISMMVEPNVRELATKLSDCLEEAEA
jgi:thioesterase domain-containing protein